MLGKGLKITKSLKNIMDVIYMSHNLTLMIIVHKFALDPLDQLLLLSQNMYSLSVIV